ncbi:MAG: flagellar hook-associated protein FlgK [Candidatus Melainabacteria bacterium]|nr:flagellar hook-associated protein FlgK [Candidatus Melainabacteria bacterium]
MISPGFFGLFNAHRGILAAQSALDVINHNVANAATPGYSRQRVDLAAYFPYQAPGLNAPPGQFLQMGQGVIAEEITRLRDSFLDTQYRVEHSTQGLNVSTNQTLKELEGILTEPSDEGINAAIQRFFDSAQAMALSPENIAARTQFMQSAADMVDTFKLQANQLQSLRDNLVGNAGVAASIPISQLGISVTQVNEALQTIVRLNQQINTVTASGAQPNDLLDQRDKILDDLSEIIDLDITPLANNQISIRIGGELMVNGVTLSNTLEVIANPGPAPTPDDQPTLVRTVTGTVNITNTIAGGKIRSILNMGGVSTTQATVRGLLNNLNSLLTTIRDRVNAIQTTTSFDLNGAAGVQPIFNTTAGAGLDIFRITVNPTVSADPRLIAAAFNDGSGFLGVGDNRNAQNMVDLFNQTFAALGNTGFKDYFDSVVSKLGIDAAAFKDRATSQSNLVNSLDTRREAVFGVNVDEEMIDMLRFQRALEASSRMVRVFDDVAKTIIGMV